MPWITGLLMWQSEVAHQIALLPLLCLALAALCGKRLDAGWWWLAVAFLVSWVADTAADFLPTNERWPLSIAYPISQAGLVCAVLLARREALVVAGVLMAAGLATALWRGVEGPDVLLRSVAFLTVVAVAWSRWDLPAWLRPALLIYFLGGWIGWLVHVRWLVVATWYLPQAARLVGLSVFCYACWRASPRLRLMRA